MKTQFKVEEFIFEKKDGSIRRIKGSRDFKNLKKCPDYVPPKNVRKSSPNVTVFWDIESKQFKSFITKNLISKRVIKYNHPLPKRVENRDFYNKKSHSQTIIKPNKSPFYVLSLLYTFKKLQRNKIMEMMEYISEKTNISKNQKRTTRRILKAFEENNIVRRKGDKYIITRIGKKFMEQNVQRELV